jgi:hypothetical protein
LKYQELFIGAKSRTQRFGYGPLIAH